MDQPKKGSPIFFCSTRLEQWPLEGCFGPPARPLSHAVKRHATSMRPCSREPRQRDEHSDMRCIFRTYVDDAREQLDRRATLALSCPESPFPTQPYPVPHALTCKIGIARQLMLSRAHPRLSHCSSNRCRTSCRPSAALRQLELARDAASIRRRRRPGGR